MQSHSTRMGGVRFGLAARATLIYAAIAAAAAAAEEAADTAAEAADPKLEEIVVIAHPLSAGGLSQAAVVLDGVQLERDLGDNIGATVSRQAGIHSASFGPAVGRPVVNGLSGPRVRIMEDRIDAMDVSVTSGDHAVTVEPALANRVEVLKGPSVLLYGSGAIGGVVDVHTGRIPHEQAEGVSGRVIMRAADNGDQRSTALRLDGGGGQLAWHLDAFRRSADEYDIPGFAESARFRAAEEAEEEHHDEDEHGEGEDHHDEDEDHDEHEDEHEDEEVFGHLPGSQSEGQGGAFGASWVGERGFVGVSFSRLKYDYGLPGGHAHAHGHEDEHEDEHHEEGAHEEEHEDEDHDEHDEHEEEGNVTLDLEQTRIDFEAGIEEPFANASALNIRFASNDYAHVEIEPNGEIATRFAVESYEGRVEVVQNDGRGLDGAGGLQFSERRFSAVGEEAYVPPVDTSTIGVFVATEYALDGFDLESGARFERVQHDPLAGGGSSFSVFSASLGAVVPTGNALFGIEGCYSSRAPVAIELYSYGAHLAVQSFEIGNPDLDVESAWHGSATLSWSGERASLSATAFAATFGDYIYAFADGTEEDGLPVRRFGQADAQLRGIDLAGSVTFAEFDGGSAALTFLADTVALTIDVSGNDNVPLVPPSRVGMGLRVEKGRYSADLDYLHVFEQSDNADFELPTDSYADLRLHLAAEYEFGNARVRAFLQGRNLTDDEQRHHSSIVKDMAPAPGRTVVIGTEVSF